VPALWAGIRGAPAIAQMCEVYGARGAARQRCPHGAHISADAPAPRCVYCYVNIRSAARVWAMLVMCSLATAGAIVPSWRERTSLRCAPVA